MKVGVVVKVAGMPVDVGEGRIVFAAVGVGVGVGEGLGEGGAAIGGAKAVRVGVGCATPANRCHGERNNPARNTAQAGRRNQST